MSEHFAWRACNLVLFSAKPTSYARRGSVASNPSQHTSDLLTLWIITSLTSMRPIKNGIISLALCSDAQHFFFFSKFSHVSAAACVSQMAEWPSDAAQSWRRGAGGPVSCHMNMSPFHLFQLKKKQTAVPSSAMGSVAERCTCTAHMT